MKINGKEWKREGGIEIAEEIHTKQKLKRLRSLLQATMITWRTEHCNKCISFNEDTAFFI